MNQAMVRSITQPCLPSLVGGFDARLTPTGPMPASLRSTGERANTQLKYWRILHKLRSSPHRASRLAKPSTC